MATRSTGTGVIVSLVVFVITTVALLVMSIAFYAQKTDLQKQLAENRDVRIRFVKDAEQQRADVQQAETDAQSSQRSVVDQLLRERDDHRRYISGSTQSLTSIKSDFELEYGIDPDESIAEALDRMQRQARSLEQNTDSLQQQLSNRDAEIEALQNDLENEKQTHDEEVTALLTETEEYRLNHEGLYSQIRETRESILKTLEEAEKQYQLEIADCEERSDDMIRELTVLRERLSLLEIRLNETRPDIQNLAELADGQVMETSGSNGEVYIDLGSRQRVVLGMTFEVYDSASSIRINPQTGELVRGKASLEVLKVSESTATCLVTRSVPGRPVVRNDIIVNAVYDPNYRFKFLVHGKFDLDGNGRPTEAEAEDIRELAKKWGGDVYYGDEIPGDLDFLVLGVVPPRPAQPSTSATETQLEFWVEQRAIRQQYEQLLDHAISAKIPVLNQHRFLTLIGHVAR